LRRLLLLLVVGCVKTAPSGTRDTSFPSDDTTPADTDADADADSDADTDGDTDTDTATTDPCGGCPAETVCGTANGIPVCRDAVTGIPRLEHILVILMENTTQH